MQIFVFLSSLVRFVEGGYNFADLWHRDSPRSEAFFALEMD